MRFGFNAYDKPPEEYFDYAVRYGLAHMEIDLIKGHSAIDTFDRVRISDIVKRANQSGISLSLHAPYSIDLPSRMPLARRSNIAYLKKSIGLAHELQADHITLHIGRVRGFPIYPWMRQETLVSVVKILRKLEPVCHKYGIPLALENASTATGTAEAASLGDNVDDFLFIFEKVDSEFLKLCLDVGHANTNAGAVAYVDVLADWIFAIHCHDNEGIKDDHLDIGAGTVPWYEVGKALSRMNFKGSCVTECFKQPPHEAAKKIVELFASTKL